MQNLSAAELIAVDHHMQAAIAGIRFLHHCANETADTQFKQLCHQFAVDSQNEVQQMLALINAPSMTPPTM